MGIAAYRSAARGVLIVLVAAACQTAAPAPVTTPAPLPTVTGAARGEAAFVIASITGIIALDRDGRPVGSLIAIPAQTFAATPALRPDGRQLAFALTSLAPGTPNGFGSDIVVANVDGSGMEKIVSHEQANTFYSGPAYDPTGQFVYFQRRASVTRDGVPVNDDAIERFDLRTRERTRVLADGTDPTVSPDGRTLVYVHLAKGLVDALWTADIDGKNARPFLKVRDRFYYVQTPRFAPTGCQIVFSGAGRSVRGDSAGGHLAHLGVPSELYLSPCDGSSVLTIGETYDDVAPVWSADGTRVAYALGGAVSILTVATREVKRLAQTDVFSYGDVVWLR